MVMNPMSSFQDFTGAPSSQHEQARELLVQAVANQKEREMAADEEVGKKAHGLAK